MPARAPQWKSLEAQPPASKKETPDPAPIPRDAARPPPSRPLNQYHPTSKSATPVPVPQTFVAPQRSAREMSREGPDELAPESDPPKPTRIRTSIEVRIPQRVSASRTYGPPPLPISLVPANDSTAYIIDRMLYRPKGVGPDGKELAKVQIYFIGWKDLPAARKLIRADRVLEYVSPFTLEEYEFAQYKMSREEAQRKRAMVEAAAAVEAASKKEACAVTPKQNAPRPGKRRGRPRRIMLEVPLDTDEEMMGVEVGRWSRPKGKTEVPSLSTPTKAQLKALEAEDDMALYEQFYGQGIGGEEGLYGFGEQDEIAETEGEEKEEEEEEGSSFDIDRALAVQLGRDLPSPEAPPRKRLKSSSPMEEIMATTKPLHSSKPTKQNFWFSGSPLASVSPPPLQVARAVPTNKNLGRGTAKNLATSRARSETPKLANASTRRDPPARAISKPVSQSRPQTPITRPSTTSDSARVTPKRSVVQSRAQTPNITTRFTPVALSPEKWKAEAAASSQSQRETLFHASPSKKEAISTKKPKPKIKPPPKEDPEPRWAVKRLEEVSTHVVDGKPVRYFLVRWEGDWPPDQNPTWEPEGNINRDLVRTFMRKRKKSLMLMDGTVDKMDELPPVGTAVPPPPSTLRPQPERRYSSVAEAFEGVDLQMGEVNGVAGQNGVGGMEADGEDEMLMVDEGPVTKQPIEADVLDRELRIAVERAFRVGP